jgi:uncharacterized protein
MIYIKRYLLLIPGLVLACLLPGCDSTDNSSGDGSNFDRGVLLENFATNIIIPSYQDFATKAEALATATVSFNQNTNEENLSSLQTAWRDASESWSGCDAFNHFGPAYDSSFVTRIDNFPTDFASIETKISSVDALNASYIENQGSRSKGLPAFEYLIFSKDGNSAVLSRYQSGEAGRRRQYLQALADNLVTKSKNLVTAWNNYKPKFLASTGTDAGSSTNLLANSLIQAVENIKNNKLGEPAGKKSAGGVKPNMVEAPYSGYSVRLMKADLKKIQGAFAGIQNGSNQIGFDDYLNHVNAKWQEQLLSERINAQFESVGASMTQITMPLEDAVSSQTEAVDLTYNSLTSLISLLKGEMISKLGLSVTYSDNDGD